MAVTIHQTPESYTPSDNPVVWTFSSDQTAQDNFVYIVKVYINDTLVKNELVFPESGIYGRYDASSWAANVCDSPTISDDIGVDANNYADVRITIVERYGDPATDQASTAGTNITVFKAKMDDEDFADWDPSGYIFGSDAAWLTTFPSNHYPKVRRTLEKFKLMAINDENALSIIFRVYDADGVEIANDTYGLGGSSAWKLTILNCAPAVIINETSLTQANFDDGAYYTVEDALDMIPYRIDLADPCVSGRYKRLHWLSQWGSIESFSFNLASYETGKITSSSYSKEYGLWNGNQFQFNNDQGRALDFGKTVDRSLVIESDWISEDIQHWIVRDLYSSVLVYVEDQVGSVFNQRKIMATAYKDNYDYENLLFKEMIKVGLPSYKSAVL